MREFLKHFSETQWSRVIKASVILGIQELERSSQIHNLSCQDLEDIVGKFEAPRALKKFKFRATFTTQKSLD